MEPSLYPDSDDALSKQPYQGLLEAFRQHQCIPIDITKLNPDGSIVKLDNGFRELIDHAVCHRYPTHQSPYLKLVAQHLWRRYPKV